MAEGSVSFRDSYLLELATSWLACLRRRQLGFSVVLLACLGLGVAYLLIAPKTYRAEAHLLPPGDAQAPSQILSQISALTGIQGLQRGNSLAPLYPDIARSRPVLERVLAAEHQGRTFRSWLAGTDELSPREERLLLRRLNRQVRGYITPITGLITLEATGADPDLVAPLLAEVLRQMDDFFQHRLVSEARARRTAIEARLAEVASSLSGAEEALEAFLSANRGPVLSPGLQTQAARLRREVEINSSLYIELKRQHEVARVEEVGTVPTLRVLSSPQPPLSHSSPRRALVLFLAGVLGLLLAALYAYYAEIYAFSRGHRHR